MKTCSSSISKSSPTRVILMGWQCAVHLSLFPHFHLFVTTYGSDSLRVQCSTPAAFFSCKSDEQGGGKKTQISRSNKISKLILTSFYVFRALCEKKPSQHTNISHSLLTLQLWWGTKTITSETGLEIISRILLDKQVFFTAPCKL